MITYPFIRPALKVVQPLGTFFVAVLPAELLGSKKLAIVGRMRILDRLKECLQGGFLLRAAPKQKHHARGGHFLRRRAAIVSRLRQRMDVARQSYQRRAC